MDEIINVEVGYISLCRYLICMEDLRNGKRVTETKVTVDPNNKNTEKNYHAEWRKMYSRLGYNVLDISREGVRKIRINIPAVYALSDFGSLSDVFQFVESSIAQEES